MMPVTYVFCELYDSIHILDINIVSNGNDVSVLAINSMKELFLPSH